MFCYIVLSIMSSRCSSYIACTSSSPLFSVFDTQSCGATICPSILHTISVPMPLKIDISLPPLPHIHFPRMPYLRPTITLIKKHRSRHRRKSFPPIPPTPIANMDPDCAICSHPALAQCECEAKALDEAVRQAEQRMMASVFNDIRYHSPACPTSAQQ